MDCIFNYQIPTSTSKVLIIRPSSKTWINGIPLSYSDEYNSLLLKDSITEKEFASIME
jgi:hypothetical protein